jgi:hypothetical protein
MSVVLNFIRGEENVKQMVAEAMDIALILKEVTQDKDFTNEDKALVVQEIKDFSDAAIKFIDELQIPS